MIRWKLRYQSTKSGRWLRRSVVGALAALAMFTPVAQAQEEPSFGTGQSSARGQAARQPNTLLVGFKPQQSRTQREQVHRSLGLRAARSFSSINVDVVELPDSANAQRVAASYRNDPNVAYVEPNYYIHALATPNDPNFDMLWGLNNPNDADIDAPEAWSQTTGSQSVTVAVIDSGVDYNHPDLAANMWTNAAELNGVSGVDDDGNGVIDDIHGANWTNGNGSVTSGDPYDDNSHGTHCAGTIGAVGNDGNGIPGVNWNVSIMGLKFLTASGSGSTADAIAALEYAVNMGARISNNSWGGGGNSQALADMIEYARQNGHLFVAAAGNSGVDNDVEPHYPSSYPHDNIIAVAASDSNDQKASFSQYGANSVDLAAPGVGIVSTVPGDSYASYNGTSMATPHVTGVAALLLSEVPNASYMELRDWLLAGVDVLPNWSGLTATGGRLNAYNSLQFAGSNDAVVTLETDVVACAALSISVNVRDFDLLGQGASTVTAFAYDAAQKVTDSETVTLIENASSTVGLFEGDIPLENAPATANDGTLQLGGATTIEVAYVDTNNSNGNPTTVVDTATVDCEYPFVTAIDTDLVGLNRVRITYQTSEPCEGIVWYGTTCDFNAMQPMATTQATSHTVELTALEPETQYAFQIEIADPAGNITLDDNNGACYSFTTSCVTALFNAEFTSSDDAFVQDSLWHVANDQCEGALPGHSAGGHLYFGVDETCTYDNGTQAGSATSPGIDLMNTMLPELRFRYYLETEQNPNYDQAFVRISTDGTNFAPIASNVPGEANVTLDDPTGEWKEVAVDLSAYQDQTIWIQFHFDTIDAEFNTFGGFYVDDVRVLDSCVEPKTGAIAATLTPAEAINEGAQWRIDGGTWLNSGVQVIDLALGDHQIEFKSVVGWNKPAKKTVQVLADQVIDVTGNYEKVEVMSSLKVNIAPATAIQSGAMWRVDGGAWQQSGVEVTDLAAGVHTVEYADASGFYTPTLETVMITSGQNYVMTKVYNKVKQPTGCNAGMIDAGSTPPPMDFLLLAFAVTMFAFCGKLKRWLPIQPARCHIA